MVFFDKHKYIWWIRETISVVPVVLKDYCIDLRKIVVPHTLAKESMNVITYFAIVNRVGWKKNRSYSAILLSPAQCW